MKKFYLIMLFIAISGFAALATANNTVPDCSQIQPLGIDRVLCTPDGGCVWNVDLYNKVTDSYQFHYSNIKITHDGTNWNVGPVTYEHPTTPSCQNAAEAMRSEIYDRIVLGENWPYNVCEPNGPRWGNVMWHFRHLNFIKGRYCDNGLFESSPPVDEAWWQYTYNDPVSNCPSNTSPHVINPKYVCEDGVCRYDVYLVGNSTQLGFPFDVESFKVVLLAGEWGVGDPQGAHPMTDTCREANAYVRDWTYCILNDGNTCTNFPLDICTQSPPVSFGDTIEEYYWTIAEWYCNPYEMRYQAYLPVAARSTQ